MATASPHVTLPEIRERLRAFDFAGLFNDLGWDYPRSEFPVEIDETVFTVQGIAEKRGVQIFRCAPSPDGKIPDAATRRRIDREVTRQAREHLLVFTDGEEAAQIWRWELSVPGRPLRSFEYEFRRDAREEQVAQILRQLFVSIDQEERPGFSIVDVTRQMRGAFEADRVTRRFYDRFRDEHDAFRAFVSGIPTGPDRDWYASVMLNRLMFVYFIQKKGFLDGDHDYLRHKLDEVRETQGSGQFLSFYRYFLLTLFHQGLSQQSAERSAALDTLLGDVPYLNGGLFDVHALEAAYEDIDIPDEAFEQLFGFFDSWRWHLDERPLREDDEINPDVLGYIFEKYINQKQMGAYYSKEDITGYIARNTIIPRLFDMARQDVRIAFAPNSALWRLLQEDPDRYIYPAMQHGMNIALPAEIEAGRTDVAKRGGWNRAAPAAYALPTETWREHVARRERYEEVWFKLADGEVNDIDESITLNLNIHQFAVDAITECEGSETIRALWEAIQRISVLDPTCGSGAFLFAALNILQPLAEACLERMQTFVDELDRADVKQRPERFRPFRQALAEAASHHNREYYVLKQIVLNNLYGVDIMEEAVEICKLRLFLKLVAQVETTEQIEPLPDIDFNIRAGNTLVGFASFDDVDKSLRISGPGQLQMVEIIETTAPAALQRIDEEAEKTGKAFRYFRTLQNEGDDAPAQRAAKEEVRERLATLREELDRLQARVYKIDPSGPDYADWRKGHEPFHWVTEFYDIIQVRGGFDVIIGNPPYIEYSKIRSSYTLRAESYSTLPAGNLYAPVIERSFALGMAASRIGMIVQLSAICTDRMEPLQDLFMSDSSHVWASCFDDRPAKLFDGLEHIRATILLSKRRSAPSSITAVWTTNLLRWHAEARDWLFADISYGDVSSLLMSGSFPKAHDRELHALIKTVQNQKSMLARIHLDRSGDMVHYYRSPLYWIRGMDFLPFFSSDQANRSVHHFKNFGLTEERLGPVVGALINSTLFYLWFTAIGNGRNVALRDITTFRAPETLFQASAISEFSALFAKLMEDYKHHSEIRTRRDGVSYQEFYPSRSKDIIDEIDRALARHYGFGEKELDFILNYDVKYRMGRSGDSEAA